MAADRTSNSGVSVDIVEYGGPLEPRNENGWAMEVNLVSWNGSPPKIDIRSWSADHSRMARGITLTEDQARKLNQMLSSRFRDRHISASEKGISER